MEDTYKDSKCSKVSKKQLGGLLTELDLKGTYLMIPQTFKWDPKETYYLLKSCKEIDVNGQMKIQTDLQGPKGSQRDLNGPKGI